MRRSWSLVVTALLVMLVIPRSAHAWDWWDWANQFSGPGPFFSRGDVMAEICPDTIQQTDPRTKETRSVHTLEAPYNEEKRVPCFFFDWRGYSNKEDDNFGAGKVTTNWYESGASLRLHEAFDLGFGMGVLHTNANDHGETRFVITAPRLVFKPGILFKSDEFWKQNRWWRRGISTLKFYVRGNIIVGDLTGADFGLKPGHPNYNFKSVSERMISAGFILDPTALLR